MKRRTLPTVKRDHELEKVKAMTAVSLSQNEMTERLNADKRALEERLHETFQVRNELRKLCRTLPESDPNLQVEGLDGLASHHFQRLNERISNLSARLRNVKEQLG